MDNKKKNGMRSKYDEDMDWLDEDDDYLDDQRRSLRRIFPDL